jgi:peroxiredoxin
MLSAGDRAPDLELPDQHGETVRLSGLTAFGVARPGPLWNRRATFVIDRDGTVLEALRSEMNMDVHADRALDVLRAASNG